MARRVVSSVFSETVDEATAESHDRALAVVQLLLIERGIRAHRHQTICLSLHGNRLDALICPDRPRPRSRLDRYPPELAVLGPGGAAGGRGDRRASFGLLPGLSAGRIRP